MDSFEWNKIAGAVLFALLLGVGLSVFSHTLFSTEAPETPGYVVAVATEEGGGSAPAAPAESLGALLAAADAHAGEASARKCGACHTFEAGGANKVGPNLYGVVDRPIASHEGFEYDEAMKKYAEEAKNWTFEHLGAFLHDPKGVVPGTKMAFPGLKDDKERANVLAYLRTLSDNPAPLPAAAEAAPATQTASAEAGNTATDAGSAIPAEQPAAGAEATATTPAQQPAEQAAPAETPPSQAEAQAPGQPAPEQQTAAATPAPAPAPAEPAPAPQVAQTEQPAPAAAAAPAAGDATKGATFAKRCAACHNFVQGGPNVVGPNLFGVVGRAVALHEGYQYSDAMKAFAEGGKVWDPATIDAYLANPKGVVPGTKMAFPGVKSEADRANVIAYLETLK